MLVIAWCLLHGSSSSHRLCSHSSTHFWPSELRVQIGQCCQSGPVSRSLLAFGGKGWYAESHPGWSAFRSAVGAPWMQSTLEQKNEGLGFRV